MCKIDTILSPSNAVPERVLKASGRLSARQIQYNSDVVREAARIRNCSMSELIPQLSQSKPRRVLNYSFKNKIMARQAARCVLAAVE